MPAWLIKTLIGLAVRFGLPWVLKHFPGIPEAVRKIIEQLLEALAGEPSRERKRELVKQAKRGVDAAMKERE